MTNKGNNLVKSVRDTFLIITKYRLIFFISLFFFLALSTAGVVSYKNKYNFSILISLPLQFSYSDGNNLGDEAVSKNFLESTNSVVNYLHSAISNSHIAQSELTYNIANNTDFKPFDQKDKGWTIVELVTRAPLEEKNQVRSFLYTLVEFMQKKLDIETIRPLKHFYSSLIAQQDNIILSDHYSLSVLRSKLKTSASPTEKYLVELSLAKMLVKTSDDKFNYSVLVNELNNIKNIAILSDFSHSFKPVGLTRSVLAIALLMLSVLLSIITVFSVDFIKCVKDYLMEK